jgi:hypothetical protein
MCTSAEALVKTNVAPFVHAPGRMLTGNPPCNPLARRRCRVHRLPRPTFVTMANAPLQGHGMAKDKHVIWV